MILSQPEWFLWMAGTTGLFWLIPRAYRFYLLPLITALFLLRHDPYSCAILIGFTLSTHCAATANQARSWPVITGLVVVFTTLLGFKIASQSAGESLIEDTLIPFGLSFYALRCAHYLLEVYKGKLRPGRLIDVVGYLFFLPTLYVGPIHRYQQFDDDRRRHRWNSDLFSTGIERIISGYFRVAVLGNFLCGRVMDYWINEITREGTGAFVYLTIVKNGLNLYFQFSGVSSIAIGFAALLGFKVMENFDRPYLKTNISDFWRSWHISLTSWIREYAYTSIFSITRSPVLGVIGTMVLIGLWHEVSLRYLVWGAYHGLGIVIWQQIDKRWTRRLLPQSSLVQRPLNVIKILVTVHFVWAGFLIVQSPDLLTAWSGYTTLLTGW